jgi:hypothetical protein
MQSNLKNFLILNIKKSYTSIKILSELNSHDDDADSLDFSKTSFQQQKSKQISSNNISNNNHVCIEFDFSV